MQTPDRKISPWWWVAVAAGTIGAWYWIAGCAIHGHYHAADKHITYEYESIESMLEDTPYAGDLDETGQPAP